MIKYFGEFGPVQAEYNQVGPGSGDITFIMFRFIPCVGKRLWDCGVENLAPQGSSLWCNSQDIIFKNIKILWVLERSLF